MMTNLWANSSRRSLRSLGKKFTTMSYQRQSNGQGERFSLPLITHLQFYGASTKRIGITLSIRLLTNFIPRHIVQRSLHPAAWCIQDIRQTQRPLIIQQRFQQMLLICLRRHYNGAFVQKLTQFDVQPTSTPSEHRTGTMRSSTARYDEKCDSG